jgi:hypothetical protein
LSHGSASAYNVGKAVFRLQLLAEVFDQTEVTEGLNTTDRIAAVILEDGRRDADGQPISSCVKNVNGFIDDRPAGCQSLPQRTGRFADACPKHLAAVFANRLLAFDARNPFSRPIERRDAPLTIHGKYTVVDGIKDDGVVIAG